MGNRLVWNENGALVIGGTNFTRYDADISAYDALGVVGSDQHCGAFAQGITADPESINGDDRSTGDAGVVLKESNATPDATGRMRG